MKTQTHTGLSGTHLELIAASEAASRSIPPLWPLSSSVAVNPFLGQSGQTLASTGAQLGRAAGLRITMPKGWYAARIEDGTIGDADLTAALAGTDQSVAALKAAVQTGPAHHRRTGPAAFGHRLANIDRGTGRGLGVGLF
jgi:uncharacterized protein